MLGKQADAAAEALYEFLAKHPVGQHVLTIGVAEDGLIVYLKRPVAVGAIPTSFAHGRHKLKVRTQQSGRVRPAASVLRG